METPACHAYIDQTYPALEPGKFAPVISGFVPVAYRWLEVGPGMMVVGVSGWGRCDTCGQGFWYTSDDNANTLTIRAENINEASFEQMNVL